MSAVVRRFLFGLLVIGMLGLPGAGSVRAVPDETPPTGSATLYTYHHEDESIEFAFAFSDPESGLASIAMSCDGGPEATYPYATRLTIKRMDPAAGGCATLGEHTFSARVINGAGLDTTVGISGWTVAVVRLEYPVAPQTGKPFTIRPVYSDGYTPPSNAVCRWELRWGSTRALRDNLADESFGGLLFEGPASAGFCGDWTFTLPWVPVRQFEVTFTGSGAAGVKSTEWPDRDLFYPNVSGTDRRIHQSNLPIVQVLPSTYTPTVGKPVTYTRYLIGGAVDCCTPTWIARLGNSETPKTWQQSGGSTFTVTPTGPGNLVVGWDRRSGTYRLGGYYDPPVRYADRIAPNTTVPVQKLGGGTVGDTAPLRLTWGGSDSGWGISSFRLERSVSGGAWTNVPLPSSTAKSIVHPVSIGKTYRFRVRATDKAGNVGAWDYGPSFKARRIADTSSAVLFSSGWRLASDPTAFGGVLHEVGTAGKASSFRFSGRDIAWIAERGPGHGQAKVYIDGRYVRTVDLVASGSQPRYVVFTHQWPTVGTHTIRIVVVGTAGRPVVSADGFVLLGS